MACKGSGVQIPSAPPQVRGLIRPRPSTNPWPRAADSGCWVRLDKKLMEQVVPQVPLAWDVAKILTAPGLTRYEFDQ
jgi:hypothetical protein